MGIYITDSDSTSKGPFDRPPREKDSDSTAKGPFDRLPREKDPDSTPKRPSGRLSREKELEVAHYLEIVKTCDLLIGAIKGGAMRRSSGMSMYLRYPMIPMVPIISPCESYVTFGYPLYLPR